MDKKFMNKLDDMELDMVAGGKLDGMEMDMVASGGFFNTLKEAAKSVVKSAAKPMKKLIEADIEATGYYRVYKFFKNKMFLPPHVD